MMKQGDRVQFLQIPPRRVIDIRFVGQWGHILSIDNGKANIKLDEGGVLRQIGERFLNPELVTPPTPAAKPGIITRTPAEELEAIRLALLAMPWRNNQAVIQARYALHQKRKRILETMKPGTV